MSGVVTRRMTGWGGVPAEVCSVVRPERRHELRTLLAGPGPLLARGLGRSYGDAALNGGGTLVSMPRLNRLLAFDEASGVAECEGGVSIGELVDTFLPRGWFPAVTPGTRHVTVGGAIACDVHGKNHPTAGSFVAHVEEIVLVTPAEGEVRCSVRERPEVFAATAGGMGLTGVIATARVRLRRVAGAAVEARHVRAGSLDEVLEGLRAPGWEYAAAWVDALRGGRGVVSVARHVDGPAPLPARGARLSVPARIPAPIHRWTTRALNGALFARAKGERAGVEDVRRFLYPLDAVENWSRLYGRRGMVQYQFAVPAGAEAVLAAVLARVAASGEAPALAVLKRLGPAGPGLLSFPLEGHTLALDFPYRPGVRTLARALDGMVAEAGGRVYLAKDALLDPPAFTAMYPNVERFLAVRRTLDPEGVLSSSLARRVGLA